MSKWNSKNRHKFLLQYHVIFICNYRKKLFLLKKLADDIKNLSYEICNKQNIKLKHLETDEDHIHYVIEAQPSISISKIVNLIKSYTTYHILRKYPNYLSKYFWKEKIFYTDGYFVSSIGNVSEDNLKKYIENQDYGGIKYVKSL